MKNQERVWRVSYLALFLVVLAAIGLHLLTVADVAFLWSDELFSWWVAGQESWPGLWAAMYRGSDGMFPAFYIFSWCWIQLFGHSDLILRLPSLLFTLLGALLCFALIRRLWSDAAAVASVGVMIVGNGLLLTQAAQFRGYGLLLGLTAFSLYLLVALSPTTPRRRTLLWANAATQLLLCLTHPFGVLYSFALGTGRVAATALLEERRWDWGLLWSYLPAGVGLLVWLPGMRAVAQLNAPRGFMAPITATELGGNLIPQLDAPWGWAGLFAGFVILIVAGALAREKPLEPEPRRTDQGTAIILAAAVLGVGPLAWVFSQITEPLFLPRYFLPSAWAWAILGAAVWSHLARLIAPGAQFAAVVLVLGLSCFGPASLQFPQLSDRSSKSPPLLARLRYERAYAIGEVDRRYIVADMPVLVEGLHSFLARDFYNPGKFDYRLVLNQESALAEGEDVRGASLETNIALRLRENGLGPGKIIDVREASTVVGKLTAFYFIDLQERPTTDLWQEQLKRSGWREEIVAPSLYHPNAGSGVIKKFTRQADAVPPP
jgi:hypothetical protein